MRPECCWTNSVSPGITLPGNESVSPMCSSRQSHGTLNTLSGRPAKMAGSRIEFQLRVETVGNQLTALRRPIAAPSTARLMRSRTHGYLSTLPVTLKIPCSEAGAVRVVDRNQPDFRYGAAV